MRSDWEAWYRVIQSNKPGEWLKKEKTAKKKKKVWEGGKEEKGKKMHLEEETRYRKGQEKVTVKNLGEKA